MYPELLRVGVKMSMGKRILELRMKKGMTQEEVGKIVGVQKAAVQKWENGLRYLFPDGSAIVAAESGWDVEGEEPFSWEGA